MSARDIIENRDKRITRLETALRMCLSAMARQHWEDGPTFHEAREEAHEVLHEDSPFDDIDCPICQTKAKPDAKA